MLENAARRLFRAPPETQLFIVPAPRLQKVAVRKQLRQAIQAGSIAVVYLQDKLGGEISIGATPRSPELAFDTTMVEISSRERQLNVGRYGIFEIQTMDFHGSYKYAVNNLRDGLRLHPSTFPAMLRQNPGWLSESIEGPNIANVFKRTFYQMMLKFQIGEHEQCAGCVLAIPSSVWDSWQKHLGKPELIRSDDGTYKLREPGADERRTAAWIYVFDINCSNTSTPNPIEIKTVIQTTAEAVSYYALKVVPSAAIASGGSADRIRTTILKRLRTWWPELHVVQPGGSQ